MLRTHTPNTAATPATALRDRIAALYRKERTKLCELAFRIVGNRHDAEDAVQEAFVQALEMRAAPEGDLDQYVRALVRRACGRRLRVLREERGFVSAERVAAEEGADGPRDEGLVEELATRATS